MKDTSFITASELAKMLGMSVGHAYKIIHKLNGELSAKGFMTFSGRVPRKYLEERCYGLSRGGTNVESGV